MSITLKYKEVKIRKEHSCFGCLRKFEPGIKMIYWVCVDSGQINCGYTCKTCEEISQYLDSNDELYEGFTFEALDKDQTPEEYLNELKKWVNL